MNTKHTPTPWEIEPHTMVDKEFSVGPFTLDYDDVDHDEQDANAEFMVRAVNSHDALLAAAKTVVKNAKALPGMALEDCGGIDELAAAIAAAEKER